MSEVNGQMSRSRRVFYHSPPYGDQSLSMVEWAGNEFIVAPAFAIKYTHEIC